MKDLTLLWNITSKILLELILPGIAWMFVAGVILSFLFLSVWFIRNYIL